MTPKDEADLRAALERAEQYIEHYEDASNWGGPTMYPKPLDIGDIKLMVAALSRPDEAGEHVQVERAELTAAQLSATIDALNFCLADDWDESSHEHGPEVYDRALSKLSALHGRIVKAIATPPSDHIAGPSGERKIIGVCSNRPRPSVQNNHSKGSQWWRRDVWHMQGEGQCTLCGLDCSDWLTIGDMDEYSDDCCKRCVAKFERAATPSPAQQSGELREDTCGHCGGVGDIDDGDHSCMACGGTGKRPALASAPASQTTDTVLRDAITAMQHCINGPGSARVKLAFIAFAIRQALASTPSSSPSEMGREAIIAVAREALQGVVSGASRSFKARNGKLVSIEADDGEACDIIHSDVTYECERVIAKIDALSKPTELGDR